MVCNRLGVLLLEYQTNNNLRGGQGACDADTPTETVMIQHSSYSEKPFHRSCSNCNDCEKTIKSTSYVGCKRRKKTKYDLNLPRLGVRTDYKYFCKRHEDIVKRDALCQCWNPVLDEDCEVF